MEVQWSYTQQHVDKTTNKKVLVGILKHIKTVCKIMQDYVSVMVTLRFVPQISIVPDWINRLHIYLLGI